MIPLVIRIKNFLSYGPIPQTISFENHQFICLSGDNGHGKSALLESITWVLWGIARRIHGITKDDASLMHIGENDMWVILEFEIKDIRYIVKRSVLIKNKKVHSELICGICDTNGIITKSLTEQTQRETQKIINTILGLDYETFCNSVFLKQGHSNEFSKKNPKERKDILTKILKIDILEDMRKRVHDDLKNDIARINLLKHNQKVITTSLHAENKLKEWESALHQKKSLFLKKKEVLNEKRAQENGLQKKISEYNTSFNTLYKEKCELEYLRKKIVDEIKSQTKEYRFFKKKIDTLNNKYKNHYSSQGFFEYLQKEITILESQYNHSSKAQEKLFFRKNELQIAWIAEVDTLKNTLRGYIDQKNFFIREASFYEKNYSDIKKENIEYQNDLHLHEENLRSLSLKKQRAYLVEQRKKKLSRCIQKLEIKISEIKTRLISIESSKKVCLEKTSSCPLCLQPFNENQKIICLTTLNKEQSILEKNYFYRMNNKIKLSEQNIEEKNAESTESLSLQENFLKEKQNKITLAIKSNTIKEDIIREKINVTQEELKNIEKTIFTQEQIIQDSEECFKKTLLEDSICIKLLKDIENITLTEEELRQKKNDFEEVKKFISIEFNDLYLMIKNKIKEYRRLECKTILHDLDLISVELEYQKKSYEKIHSEIQELQDILVHDHQKLAEEYAEYKSACENEMRLQKQLSEETHECLELEKKVEKKESFSHLIGKDGLQAALIEQVIPEIEYEANMLLEKLTQGKAHITIDSIRDLKSGKSKETLDIIISDSLGPRPYEFFSGGEAFRIDLSLRIALAKVLAKRSGSILQTLIIDEGFGSQDTTGLDAIIEALQKIQSDFQKIIIVSHLQSIKNEIPSIFLVQKTIGGSNIKVYRQD